MRLVLLGQDEARRCCTRQTVQRGYKCRNIKLNADALFQQMVTVPKQHVIFSLVQEHKHE